MKKVRLTLILACLSIIFILSGTLFAKGWKEGEITGSYSVGLYDQYINEWSGELLDDRLSFRGEVNFNLPHDLYCGIWSAVHLGSMNYLNGNEIDFYFGWSGEVRDILLEPRIAYYNFVPMLDGREGNVLAPSIKVSKNYDCDRWQIKPFGRVEINIPDGEDQKMDFEWDKYYSVGAENTMALSDELSICLSPYFTYEDGAYDVEGVLRFLQGVSATYLIKDFKLSFSFLLSYPFSDNEAEEMQKTFGVSLSREF